ncbi:MAG: SUMF1/EgtB/PvdO family nonheme iron enzyme, partial [Planctomycetota bacterium]
DLPQQKSLGGHYLGLAFQAIASGANRNLVEPAKALLLALTPPYGELRRSARSREDLQSELNAQGHCVADGQFAALLNWLDHKFHLVSTSSAHDAIQLTHDFLVPELRQWFATETSRTWQGRARADLRAATMRWQNDSEAYHLAGPVNCIRYGLLIRPQESSETQYVRRSARRNLWRGAILAACACVLVAVFRIAMLYSDGHATVERLMASDLDRLPAIIQETRRQPFWTSGPLATAHLEATNRQDLDGLDRIALVELSRSPDHAEYLTNRLVEADSELRKIIADRLRSDLGPKELARVEQTLAAIAEDETRIPKQRLRAIAGIIRLAANQTTIPRLSSSVCSMLVDSNPVDLGWLKDELFPVRDELRSDLKKIRGLGDPTRSRTATYLLAEFAADTPKELASLLESSSLNQLEAVFPALMEADTKVAEEIAARFDRRISTWRQLKDISTQAEESATDPDSNAKTTILPHELGRSIGNLAAALILLGDGQRVLPHLALSDDPTLRSYTIACYEAGEGSASRLVDLLLKDSASLAIGNPSDPIGRFRDLHPQVQTALLQALGGLASSSRIALQIAPAVVALNEQTQNAELHATTEWFLSRFGLDEDSHLRNAHSSVGYRTAEGQFMVLLPGGIKATVGSTSQDHNRLANEEIHAVEVPSKLYFSRHELSQFQLKRYRELSENAIRPRYQLDGNQSVMRLIFFEAAGYCNWLSEREGIPEDQWCYEPNELGVFGPGMKIADDHLDRSGYQIPTPDLWEYACRGGTTTTRPYGQGTELSSGYIRWMGTKPGMQQQTAARKPNGYGLFDMLGNRSEWTVGLVDGGPTNGPTNGPSNGPAPNAPNRFPPRREPGQTPNPNGPMTRPAQPMNSNAQRPSGPGRPRASRPGLAFGGGPILISAAGKTIRQHTQFAILGGAFDSPAHKVRSSDRSMISPALTNKPITLRLMRIIPQR